MTVFVDVYYRYPPAPALTIALADAEWCFVFGRERKRGVRFSHGLFMDEDALQRLRPLCYPRERRLAALRESPLHSVYSHAAELSRRFARVFTFSSELLSRGTPFVRHLNGTNWLGGKGEGPEFEKSRDVSFIGNVEHPDHAGYLLRKQVAEYLAGQPGVDCYGKGIRWVGSKLEAIAPYRFSVAMENVRSDQYFSEKLVDCILTETVPVYWGCPSIGDILDARGLVTFETLEQLKAVLPRLDASRYADMLPYLRANRTLLISSDLHSATGYFRRIAAAVAAAGPPPAIGRLRRSMAAALIRRAGEVVHRRGRDRDARAAMARADGGPA
jgi:hypothetical protein